MLIDPEIKLDFEDVLIKPKRSQMSSRLEVDLERHFVTFHSKKEIRCVPVIAANMDSTGTFKMANALSKYKMLTCLHKFYPLDDLVNFFKDNNDYCFYTLGTKQEEFNQLIEVNKHVKIGKICVDIANGYSVHLQKRLIKIRESFPDSILMAGNVCTPEMVQELLIACGVDIVKVGIGGGKACQTRFVTGVGYPQLSAVIECADAAHGIGGLVCSDGGCRNSGDVAKAFCAGADFVMLGSMFSGHDECEGQFSEDGKKFVFYGMSSEKAQEKYYGKMNEYRASEGMVLEVDAKGPVETTVKSLLGGLRSTCTYVGASRLKNLNKCTTFVRVNQIRM